MLRLRSKLNIFSFCKKIDFEQRLVHWKEIDEDRTVPVFEIEQFFWAMRTSGQNSGAVSFPDSIKLSFLAQTSNTQDFMIRLNSNFLIWFHSSNCNWAFGIDRSLFTTADLFHFDLLDLWVCFFRLFNEEKCRQNTFILRRTHCFSDLVNMAVCQ